MLIILRHDEPVDYTLVLARKEYDCMAWMAPPDSEYSKHFVAWKNPIVNGKLTSIINHWPISQLGKIFPVLLTDCTDSHSTLN